MKRSVIAVMVAGMCVAGNAGATGIPVVDVANMTQNLLNHVESLAKMVEEIRQLEAQLEQARTMFNSMNGIRGMASLLNTPIARQYLPKSASDIYNLGSGLAGGRYSSITGSVAAIKSAGRIISSGDLTNPGGPAAQMMDKHQSQIASMQATAEAAFNAAGERFEQLQILVDKVDDAPDPKAIADLQARIAAEQTMMQNEMLKLDMMAKIQAAQQAQLQQQGREQNARFGMGGTPVYVTGF